MRKIEEIIGDKIIDLAHYLLAKVVKPDITIDKVNDLTVERIEELKQEYGIEAIILDVDQTIRAEMKMIPKCNQDWVDNIRGKIKIIVLSNGIDKDIEKYFQERGIDYIGFALKPLRKNFIKACEKMEVNPEKVLVIGDSLFDDIHGGKKNKMKTVLVKSVEDERI